MFGGGGQSRDPRAVVPAAGIPGGPFAAVAPPPDATVLAQELTFAWARSGTANAGNVVARRTQGRYGARVDITMSLPAGTLGMTSPALALTLDPGDSSSGVFHLGNFDNSMTFWDGAEPGRVWRSHGTGALSRTSDATLLLQSVILRDDSEPDPHMNRIRVDGTLRHA